MKDITAADIFEELEKIEREPVRTREMDRRWLFLIGYVKGRGWWREIYQWQGRHGQLRLPVV